MVITDDRGEHLATPRISPPDYITTWTDIDKGCGRQLSMVAWPGRSMGTPSRFPEYRLHEMLGKQGQRTNLIWYVVPAGGSGPSRNEPGSQRFTKQRMEEIRANNKRGSMLDTKLTEVIARINNQIRGEQTRYNVVQTTETDSFASLHVLPSLSEMNPSMDDRWDTYTRLSAKGIDRLLRQQNVTFLDEGTQGNSLSVILMDRLHFLGEGE